jgi:pimeloyl-ACP methyl ester carboxylesterase
VAEVISASPSFGDLPILVLTAGVDGMKAPHDYDVWRNQLQPELAHLSTNGRQVIVEGSTHMIPLEKPQAIVDGIRQMLLEQKAQR